MALAKHLPPFEPARRALAEEEDAQTAMLAVLAGGRPLRDLPDAYAQTLARLNDDLDGVLGATHAESADLASGDDVFEPAPGTTWGGYLLAASLTGIRIRQALAAGKAAGALPGCLDGLALARDSAVAGGLIGHMVGTGVIERLLPSCVAAFAALPETEKPEAMARLRRVRDAVPGFDVTMREEAVQMQLSCLGPQLGEGFRSRLLGRPKLMAKGWGSPTMDERSWGQRVLNRALWRDRQTAYDKLVAIAALRGAERHAAFEALTAATNRRFPLLSSELPKPADYVRYAQRAEVGILRLDLVVIAGAATSFRAAHGAWPTSVSALAKEGSVTMEETRRDSAIGFVLGEGGHLEIVLPLQPAVEDAPTEARVSLEAK